MTKRRKKTLLQLQREYTVEVSELTAYDLRQHVEMHISAQMLEKHREPSRYIK